MTSAASTVEAVIFDWGGTLSIWADVDMVDMWRLAAEHIAPGDSEALTERLVDVERRYFDRALSDQQAFALPELLRAASEEVGIDVAEAVLEEAALRHLDTWTPHIRHEPDAADVLRALRDRGLRTALLSNTHWPRHFHEHFLERDGLVELIDARLYTSEMERTKPHPDAFRAALDAVGVGDPGAAVFVGDRPHDDVFGAKSSGMRAVWRRNTFVPHWDVEPDASIDTLSDLLSVIDGWMRE